MICRGVCVKAWECERTCATMVTKTAHLA